jgi:NAD(P)-dependent dehydrogenase (short-subunit alcohol dehydrogenase family)
MEQPRFDLTDQLALVTGANKGSGETWRSRLPAPGARGGGLAGPRRGPVVEEIRAAGGEAEPVEMDLRSHDSIEQAVTSVIERFGQLDILVNNAGLGTNHDALDAAEQEWDELFEVNVRGLFFACQAAGRHMV